VNVDDDLNPMNFSFLIQKREITRAEGQGRIPQSAIRNPQSELRTAFTLIELLVVIAIIGLLAGLILGTASIASAKKTQTRVSAERDALVTTIESYKKDKGYYPPDNTNDPTCIQTPLFYELTGMTVTPGANGPGSFQSPVSGETLTTAQVGGLFPGISGFMNASGDPSSPAKDYYAGLKATQHLLVVGTTPQGSVNFTVLGVPASGPTNINPAIVGGGNPINPWHYNYSHPTNNPNSYDLWMDVKYSGKTYRFSNWSTDPQVIGP